MYQALYRAERPEVFEEVLGQEHIVKILKHQIASDTVNHAYVFTGTRGTGKTTTARLLAKAVNCLEPEASGRPCGRCANCRSIQSGSFMDVIEIDAASNNGVENIRELRESVKYPPVAGRRKVYIIDEVHMLSSGAFNALLKTLEEPPENVMFILATTEPQKLPQTIMSRCMRLDFRRVPETLLMGGMGRICREKGINISSGALKLLANAADGSVRDGLSILDQVLASGEKNIERETVLEYIGALGDDFFIQLTDLVSLRKTAEGLALLDRALSEGRDAKQLMRDWNTHYRNLLVTKFIKDPEDMLNMSADNIKKVREQSMHISLEEISDAIVKLSKTINDARWSTQPRILLELALVSIATDLTDSNRSLRREPAPAARGEMAGLSDRTPELAPESLSREEPEKRTQSWGEIKAPQVPAAKYEQPKRTMPRLEPSEDLNALWQDIFTEGDGGNGSLNLIKNATTLERVDEMTFLVYANSVFTKNFAEQRRQVLEKLMAARAGRPLRMIVELAGEKNAGGPEELSPEELAKKMSETLGISITVE